MTAKAAAGSVTLAAVAGDPELAEEKFARFIKLGLEVADRTKLWVAYRMTHDEDLVMGQPAARITDMHVCPMVTGIIPHVGGPILPPGAPTVLIGSMPARGRRWHVRVRRSARRHRHRLDHCLDRRHARGPHG